MKALIPFIGVKNVEKTVCFDKILKSIKPDGKVKSAKIKVHAWENLVSRGVLKVRRSDHEMKRNAVRLRRITKPFSFALSAFQLEISLLKKEPLQPFHTERQQFKLIPL